MDTLTTLGRAWNSLWTLKKHRDEPLWACVTVATLFALAAGTLLMAISGVLTGRESDPGWWRASYLFNMLISVMIAWAMMALTWLMERWLPERWLARMSNPTDWRAMVVCNVVLAAGLTAGSFGGLFVTSAALHFSAPPAIAHPLA